MIVFWSSADESFAKLIHKLVQPLRKKGMVACYVNGDVHGQYIRDLGVLPGQPPLVIVDYENEFHYLYGNRLFDEANVLAFVVSDPSHVTRLIESNVLEPPQNSLSLPHHRRTFKRGG